MELLYFTIILAIARFMFRQSLLILIKQMEVGAGMQTTYSRCSEIKFALQVLKDLKEISVNTFALASEKGRVRQ
jgi:hypothetical protein